MKDELAPWELADRILRMLRGDLSADEETELKDWLQQHPEHEQLLDHLQQNDRFDTDLAYISSLNQGEAWADLEARLNEREPKKGGVRALWRNIGIAVSLLLVIGFAIKFQTFYHTEKSIDKKNLRAKTVSPGSKGATLTMADGQVIDLNGEKSGIVIGDDGLKYDDNTAVINKTENMSQLANLTVHTARGQTYITTLPDGTRVWLNADSKISFPSKFTGKERSVFLDGEGYFEVKKDTDHPFIVRTDRQAVQVLGTHFNISNYKDTEVKTTLLEGSVKVAGYASKQLWNGPMGSAIVLKPNEQAVVTDGNKIIRKKINGTDAIDWKNGEFIFNDEALESIMLKISRWYDVDVIYDDVNRKEAYSGAISRFENIVKLLRKLELAGDLHFKIEGKNITVSK